MLKIIKILEDKLTKLDLSDEDKNQLSDICKKLNKQVEKSEFKLKSTLDWGKSTKSLMSAMIEEIDEMKLKIKASLEEKLIRYSSIEFESEKFNC